VQLDRLIQRPGVHLALGQLDHQPGQVLHALAVEGRQHQLALLQMRPLVEQDHRVGAHDRLEQAGPLPGVQDIGRRHEQLFDVIGIGQHDERRLTE